ncbi:uncharacterized protein F4822DRAFT_439759 [Hypoxylon trugodes]|uniref:uncharacterized protein n=1 Tax=Hypoxylon trugodes TaxID=326681 RepID=UPI00219B9052|nr:uncharacterized protein F4822DRAFT_439759 [Hypoxylon trugodes]KAI1393858.1 hypothetical protein F4822DRAFT_439759 [Hypoxylon trugodes]
MASSEQLPSTYASDDSYYGGPPPSSEAHNVSYSSYQTIASHRAPENLLGFQGQPLPPAPVPSNSHYVMSGHGPTDVNMGPSSGTPFAAPVSDPFGLPYYQSVAPDSRASDAADAYHHAYPQGYGTTMTSPPASTVSAGSSHKKHKHASRSKRSRQQQVLSPGSTSSASNSGKSRLRSASRTSKNTHHNPPASAEEQKSRETHNQVEKQYRNRLNAHFESLLDALPETMQAGEGEDEGEALDLTDRRVSKAEVLDMARRHIQTLERECAALEGERDELRNNMARLRWLFGRCETADEFNQQLNFQDPGSLS